MKKYRLLLALFLALVGIIMSACGVMDRRVVADVNTTPISQTNATDGQSVASKADEMTNVKSNGKSTTVQNSNKEIKYINSESEKNVDLSQAIIKALNLSNDEAKKTRYYYNYIDLNDDNNREVFVQLVGPFTSGSGGDTGLIFLKNNSGFEMLQQFTLVRNPIVISNEKTNGWRDIIIKISGGGMKAHYVRMSFDGSKYPNPSAAEKLVSEANITGLGIINDDIAQDFRNGKGLYLIQ